MEQVALQRIADRLPRDIGICHLQNNRYFGEQLLGLQRALEPLSQQLVPLPLWPKKQEIRDFNLSTSSKKTSQSYVTNFI
jgi:hypothetical protein